MLLIIKRDMLEIILLTITIIYLSLMMDLITDCIEKMETIALSLSNFNDSIWCNLDKEIHRLY